MADSPDGLVEKLKAAGAIRSAAVEAAFRTVPRHRLLETFYVMQPGVARPQRIDHDPDCPDADHLARIYSDAALGTRFEEGWPTSSTSQPSLVARMLELLDLAPGARVLEIGMGTGYNAALLAEVVGDQALVVSVDVAADVVAQSRRLLAAAGYGDIVVVCRDGFEGAAELGPFDRMMATVACPDISPRWVNQLAAGGSMLIPLEHAGSHPLVRVEGGDDSLRGRVVGHSGFMAGRDRLSPLDWWRPRLHLPPDYRPNVEQPGGGQLHEESVWEGFGHGAPVWGGRCTSDQLDLGFYVAVRDRRAIWGGEHVGLTDGPAGWALATADSIRWCGDVRLRDDLHALHRDWTALDRPPIGSYRLAFVPRHATVLAANGSGWDVDRRYHRQHTTLSQPSP